ncbi:MAG: hypothetical protein ACYTGZ_11905 [Planctomycetota bacterium]
MSNSLRIAIVVILFAPVAPDAVASDAVKWDYEGHFRLPEAAQAAKGAKKRLLIGLSGAPT